MLTVSTSLLPEFFELLDDAWEHSHRLMPTFGSLIVICVALCSFRKVLLVHGCWLARAP